MIIIKNLTKKFFSGKSAVEALENINLEIKVGEFIALIGPSGSGKSTLLNMIGGLDTPDEGEISISSTKIANLSDTQLSEYRNLQIGFVFQEFHLEPFYTVEKNVLLPTYFDHSRPEAKKTAEKLIKEVGLEEKIHSKVNELSGGQKQRTAIARALINKPKIILADEPTGNLDFHTGQTIIELLQNLHKKHKVTLIIATHDPQIAQNADRTIRIKDGKITKINVK